MANPNKQVQHQQLVQEINKIKAKAQKSSPKLWMQLRMTTVLLSCCNNVLWWLLKSFLSSSYTLGSEFPSKAWADKEAENVSTANGILLTVQPCLSNSSDYNFIKLDCFSGQHLTG